MLPFTPYTSSIAHQTQFEIEYKMLLQAKQQYNDLCGTMRQQLMSLKQAMDKTPTYQFNDSDAQLAQDLYNLLSQLGPQVAFFLGDTDDLQDYEMMKKVLTAATSTVESAFKAFEDTRNIPTFQANLERLGKLTVVLTEDAECSKKASHQLGIIGGTLSTLYLFLAAAGLALALATAGLSLLAVGLVAYFASVFTAVSTGDEVKKMETRAANSAALAQTLGMFCAKVKSAGSEQPVHSREDFNPPQQLRKAS